MTNSFFFATKERTKPEDLARGNVNYEKQWQSGVENGKQ
jgi:hypothetical protein